MRKILYIALSLGILSSCDIDLNQQPISKATSDTYFLTVNDFTQGLNAVYSSVRGYPDRLLNLSETRSDNLYAISDGGVRDWEGINSFHKTLDANPYVTEAWQSNYTGIFRANNFLQQLQAKGESVILDTDMRMQMEGEARFLRAFYYFDLIRYFGEVPLIDRVVEAAEAKEIPRSSVSDVYNFIIEDLIAAADYLPAKSEYENGDKGRANKHAAKALLGLVYMTRSGPDLGIKGAGMNTGEWNEAVVLFNEVIASNEYSLLDSYAGIFDYTKENNDEVIFNIEYTTGATPVVGATFPWVLVPDTWFQSKGFATQGGLTIRPVSADLMNTFQENDIRKDFSIQQGYVHASVAENRPFIKKFVDLDNVPTTSRMDWPINYIVFRYTDLLLLKAECVLNGAAGSVAQDVDAIVNKVRQRAGISATLTDVTKDELLAERRHEFVGEGLRWFDLIRTGKVEQTMSSWIQAEDGGRQMQSFNVNYVLYPIPQSELNTSPGLYEQNPGY
ncbi:RagB/SusD family nutrient uptake outer membrane protein [Sphingobacterium shayense]|uniref:RagB/SusD family nutrient uptake outer membrane protein n=1 Tax=Sphingobacterium shayense TaxID=626343 RepID=UPI0015548C29|nr:RagB/SusD family nutrient uptake outer membrane protein [Sphingobacterium shayense]NQD70054.1 RagB/SusD family nutrient uptake outer membrane protein [Sphingobacterium shayense]